MRLTISFPNLINLHLQGVQISKFHYVWLVYLSKHTTTRVNTKTIFDSFQYFQFVFFLKNKGLNMLLNILSGFYYNRKSFYSAILLSIFQFRTFRITASVLKSAFFQTWYSTHPGCYQNIFSVFSRSWYVAFSGLDNFGVCPTGMTVSSRLHASFVIVVVQQSRKSPYS